MGGEVMFGTLLKEEGFLKSAEDNLHS